MRRVALTDAQIAALPDNYALAVRCHEFPAQSTESTPPAATPFLPPDLWDSHSAWLNVGSKDGIIAYTHVHSELNGRSIFLVFYHLPTGHQATQTFVNQLNASQTPHQTLGLPEHMIVAFVRQILLIDTSGNIVPSPITASIQLWELNSFAMFDQNIDFDLSRRKLFTGRISGLYTLAPTDKALSTFMTSGVDYFEAKDLTPENAQTVPLNQCGICHTADGTANILSFSRDRFPLTSNSLPQLIETNVATETHLIIAWKQYQPNWHLLTAYWGISEM